MAPSRDLQTGLLGADSAADAPVDDAIVTEPLRLPADAGSAAEPSAAEPAKTYPSGVGKAINLLMVITFMDAVEYGVVMPSLWAYLLDVLAAESGAAVDPASLPALGNASAVPPLVWVQNGTVPGDHGHGHYTSGTAHSYYGLILASFSFTSMCDAYARAQNTLDRHSSRPPHRTQAGQALHLHVRRIRPPPKVSRLGNVLRLVPPSPHRLVFAD
jgi:hypothetical protein